MDESLIQTEEMPVNRVTVEEVLARQKRGEPIAFVDSRKADAWEKADSQIPGSIRVPPDQAEQFADSVPKDRSVVTYCT